MRTITTSPVPGYVVVGSGINPREDNPHLFRDVSEWVKWKKHFDDVALIPMATAQGDDGMTAVVPITTDIGTGVIRWRFMWRLRAMVYNYFRRARNEEFAARERKYFSPEGIESRVRAGQVTK